MTRSHASALLLLMFATMSGCIFVKCDRMDGISGNGVLKTEQRELLPFKEISIDGVGSLEIRIGAKSSVTVTADENLHPFLRTDVKADRLVIHQEKSLNAKNGPHYVVTTPTITLIRASGATSIEAAQINSERLTLTQSGLGGMTLSGTVRNLVVELSGAGSVFAYSLKAENIDAVVSGVGSLKVNAEKYLKATVSGTGSIRYRGNPSVESHVSGIGSVTRE